MSLFRLAARARWIDRYVASPPWMLLLPFALLIAANWLGGLQWGLWLDECGTYWAAYKGPLEAIPRALSWKGQPPFYAFIAAFFIWGESPWREVAMRLPSFAAGIACCYVLYGLSERMNGRGSGWIAALVFAVLRSSAEFATLARPYALAQLSYAGALLCLYSWFERPSRGTLAGHFACLVAMVYLQPLFLLAWAIEALILLWRPPADWKAYWVGATIAGLATLPEIVLLASTGAAAKSYDYALNPGIREFIQFLPDKRIGLILAAGLALGLMLRLARPKALAGPWPLQIMATWIGFPVVLFGASYLLKSSLFMERYLALSSIAFALLAGLVAMWLRPWFRQAVVIVCIASRIYPGQVFDTNYPRFNVVRDWVVQESLGKPIPVISSGQFVEARYGNDFEALGSDPNSYLFATWTAYPVENPMLLADVEWSPKFAEVLKRRLDGAWRAEPLIFLGPIAAVPDWVLAILAQRGYVHEARGSMHIFRRL